MNHDHSSGKRNDKDDQHNRRKKRKGSKNFNVTPPDKKPQNVSENDDDLQIIDEYNDDNGVDDNFQINDEYIDGDGQDDGDLKIVDDYNDDEQDNRKLKVIDEYNDDGQDDENLRIIDRYDNQSKRKKQVNYKQLYQECMKSSRRLKARNKKMIHLNNKRNRNEKLESQKELNHQKLQFKNHIEDLNDKCQEKIDEIKSECNKELENLQTQHRNEYKKLEDECKEKIENLTNHIQSLQEDDESLNSLTDAIFNCTTMEEIFEIQHLIENHQIDVVIQRHLKTLQNLFFSLSFGILPICQPQREKITDRQRKLVENIQSVSASRAKGLLKQNRQDLIIIEDSLKLARNSYNKYGTDKSGSI